MLTCYLETTREGGETERDTDRDREKKEVEETENSEDLLKLSAISQNFVFVVSLKTRAVSYFGVPSCHFNLLILCENQTDTYIHYVHDLIYIDITTHCVVSIGTYLGLFT